MTRGRSLLKLEKRRSAVSGSWSSMDMVRGPGPKPKTPHPCHRTTAVLLLEDLGVFGAWELLPLRDLHHISVDLQPIAIGVLEVEGAAAAATKVAPSTGSALRTMDQGSLHNLDALALQVRQGPQPLVAISHLQRDVLQSIVAGIAVLVGDSGRMREQDDVVVVIGEAHEGHLTVLAHRPASRQREPQDVFVPRDRPVNIGALDADVPHSANRKSPCHRVILLAAGSALTLVPLAFGYACNGEYHNTDSRVLYQAQQAHA